VLSTHLLCQLLPQTFNLSSLVVILKRKEYCSQTSSFIDLQCPELASLDTEERTKSTHFMYENSLQIHNAVD